jgi:2-methylisocitrate lyase-like PEP mutase family enzyme
MVKITPGTSPELAEAFRAMHRPAAPILVVPACGDAASARIWQEMGARAIGTSSMSVATTCGYGDGEAYFPVEDALWMTRRIVQSVSLPVTADMEGGYGDIRETTEAFIEAGVVGVNLEDRVGEETTPLPLNVAVERVAASRETADRAGFPLFINARTETMALGGDLDDAITRMNAYLEAGAECVLPILPSEHRNEDTMREIVERVNGPVNSPALIRLSIPRLEEIGVKRAGIMFNHAIHGFVGSIAQQVLTEGTHDLMDSWRPQIAVSSTFQADARARQG